MNGIKERLVIKRLLKKVNGACLHRTYTYRNIGVSGYENDGCGAPCSGHLFLELKPA
jgi:hypothetical protein